jgi:hypothetical protein
MIDRRFSEAVTAMKHPYLEVTYRKGKALAAYLYLGRRSEDRSEKTIDVGNGMILDLAADGRPIGVEISSLSRFDLGLLDACLAKYGIPAVRSDEIRPIPG